MSGDGEAVIRRFYEEVWNRWCLDVADEIVAPNVRFRGTLGTRTVGLDAFKQYVANVRAAFPDWHNRIDELISSDGSVVARITCTGTHEGEILGIAPTGGRVAYDAVAIFHLEGEKIAEAWVVGDTQELWRAFGAAPSPA